MYATQSMGDENPAIGEKPSILAAERKTEVAVLVKQLVLRKITSHEFYGTRQKSVQDSTTSSTIGSLCYLRTTKLYVTVSTFCE